ncbi:MAG: family 20 glycosylhydrolase [Planctomycetota bacterium]|nr:family 20 glycosylhydrolase [Planctomycetota bacterium]
MQNRGWTLAVGLVMVAALAGVAKGQPLADPVTYQSLLGDTLTMNVWQGQYVSFLTPTTMTGLNNATMSTLIGKVDLAYDYYHIATGSNPDPWPPYYYINGRDTIAAVDNTGGAGFSWIGATGVELQTDYFNMLYNGVATSNQYDQVVFYELGRNFWLYGNQLDGGNVSNPGGPTIGQYSFTTGFAVFMRFKSMEYAGVTGAPYGSWTFSQFEDNVKALVDQYTANPTLNFSNTLAVGEGVPGSGLGGTDLFASFLFRLGRDYGGDSFFLNFWKKVGERPSVSTDQGAIDNFFLAACYTTGQDLSNLFVSQWRWTISAGALYEATNIPVVGNAWTGAGSSSWGAAGNWSLGLPANGDTITFPMGASNKANSNNLLTRVGHVYFKEGGYNITGNALLLDGGISSSGNNTWAINSTLNAPQSFTSFGGTLTISGTVNTNAKALTVSGNGVVNVTGTISGTGALTKNDAGELDLGDNAGYSGNIVVNAGTVGMDHANALGNTTGTTTFNGGSLVRVQTNAENFTIGGNATFENWGGNPHFTGGIAVNSGATLTFSTGGGNQTWMTAPISGSGNFTWVGGGASEGWVDTPSYIDGSQANTLSGIFTLTQGSLTLAKTGGTNKAVAGPLVIGGGSNRAQLYLNSSEQIGNSSMLTFTGADARFYTQGYSETLGALDVRGYGTIDFGAGASTVRFADSSADAWKKTLSLTNYNLNTDHLYVGSNAGGLTDLQLQKLQFVNPVGKTAGTYAGQILATGEVVPGSLWTAPATNPKFQIVPYPTSVQPATGDMSVSSASSIVVNDPALRTAAGVLSNEIYALTGKQLAVRRGTAGAGDIVLSLDNTLSGEKYVYDVGTQAQVRGADYQGVMQGTATLLQSMTRSGSTVTLPKAHIADEPAADTGYRALLIDISRSYHSIDTLKKEVEMCRLYKVPFIQLHLTDDQAFTFTTSVSGINGGNTTGTAGDSRTIPVYTQQQLRDLVSFADKRGVTIVPEIEIPGHAGQMVSQRPDLFKTGWYHGSTANIANPDAITALRTMVGEVANIFASSPYIHLGADEADYSQLGYHYVNYVTGSGHDTEPTVDPIPRAQWDAKMDALTAQEIAAGRLSPGSQITDPQAVFRDYLNNMDSYVNSLGKKTIVWESFDMDASVVPLNKDITVMPFDQYTPATNYINAGFDVINSSWSPLYIVGFKGDGTGAGEGLADTVANIYAWDKLQFGAFADPLADGAKNYVPESQGANVLGGQLNMWENQESAEITAARLRLAAMSERLWGADSDWTYADFSARLAHTDSLLDALVSTTGMSLPSWESIWSGGVSGSWNAAGNWGVGGVPWDGDALTFSAGAGNKANANDISGILLTHVGLVTFKEGGFNVTGSSLELDAGISSAGSNTWAVPSTLSAPQAFRSLSGTLSLTSTVDNNGYDLTVGGNGDTNVSGTISGAGGLIKTGRGTATLTGANGYSGATTVKAGTLLLDYASHTSVLNSASALVMGGGTLSVKGKSSGATTQALGNLTVGAGGSAIALNANGGSSTTLTLGTIDASTVGGSLAITTTGTVAVKTATNKTNGVYGGRITYNNDWATSSGSSPYTLAAYSSYTSMTNTSSSATTNYIQTGSRTRTANGSAYTLKLDTSGTGQSLNLGATRTLTLSGSGLLFVGAQDYSVAAGTLKGSSGGDLVVHQRGSGVLTISSVIANNSSATALTKAGPGTLVLGTSNTYTGQSYLNGGVLSISANNNLGAAATGAAVNFGGGTLRATAAVTLDNAGSNARPVVLGAAGGTVSLVGSAAALTVSGAISGEGDLTWTGDSAYPDTLSKFSGTQANTFTGTTFLTCGTLGLQKSAATDALAGDVVVGGGASRAVLKLLADDQIRDSAAVTLKLAGDTTAGYLRLNGFQDTIGGLASYAAGAGIVENAAAGASTLTVATVSGMSYTFSGALRNGAAGALNLIKSGPGTQVLAGADTRTGLTTVAGGTLSVNGSMADAAITVSGGLLNGTGTIRFLDGNVIDDNAAVDASAMQFDLTGLSGTSVTILDYAGGAFTGPDALNDLLNADSYVAGWRLADIGAALRAVRLDPLLGDFNRDGEVGPEDFGVLKDNFGLSSLPYGHHESWALGDANDDGEIGPEDFAMLKDSFGLSDPSYPLTNVPEPATMGLLALAGAALLKRRR